MNLSNRLRLDLEAFACQLSVCGIQTVHKAGEALRIELQAPTHMGVRDALSTVTCGLAFCEYEKSVARELAQRVWEENPMRRMRP